MKDGLHVDSLGSKWWCLNGEYHREDGPAIEYKNGNKYYLNGNYISTDTKSDDPKVLRLQELMKVQEVLES